MKKRDAELEAAINANETPEDVTEKTSVGKKMEKLTIELVTLKKEIQKLEQVENAEQIEDAE